MLLKSLLITAVTGRAAEILAARSACLFWVKSVKQQLEHTRLAALRREAKSPH
jgi:hypothetical protein